MYYVSKNHKPLYFGTNIHDILGSISCFQVILSCLYPLHKECKFSINNSFVKKKSPSYNYVICIVVVNSFY